MTPSGPGAAEAAPPARTLLLFAVVILCWGTGWLPISYQVNEAPPEVTLFWRFVAADILLWGIVWWRGSEWRYPPGIHLRLALMGLSMFGIPPLLGYLAKEEMYAALSTGDAWGIVAIVILMRYMD